MKSCEDCVISNMKNDKWFFSLVHSFVKLTNSFNHFSSLSWSLEWWQKHKRWRRKKLQFFSALLHFIFFVVFAFVRDDSSQMSLNMVETMFIQNWREVKKKKFLVTREHFFWPFHLCHDLSQLFTRNKNGQFKSYIWISQVI